jgi:inner membrane protein involved in colicin E2 resistance
MSDNDERSFIRWQKFRIEQLGYTNNLLIFLATGMLTFQVQLAVKELCFTILDKRIIVFFTLLLFLSLMVGCYLAWNRLRAFRITAQIARKRETEKRGGIENLRAKVDHIEKITYQLLAAQALSFLLGALLLVIFTVIQFIE